MSPPPLIERGQAKSGLGLVRQNVVKTHFPDGVKTHSKGYYFVRKYTTCKTPTILIVIRLIKTFYYFVDSFVPD